MKEYQFIILMSNDSEVAVNIDNILYVKENEPSGSKIVMSYGRSLIVSDNYEDVLLLLQSTIRIKDINK